MISRLLQRVGPAFIVGACIIGPGSVTLMSKTGSLYGYSMLWLAVLSGSFMAGFIALFMRFGIYCDDTILGLTAARLSRPFAILCGVALSSTSAAFQFGNNLGVTAAMNSLLPDVPQYVWPVLFTVTAIVFMFSLKRIYRTIEIMMTLFLVLMFFAFLMNLIVARPDVGGMAQGLIPSLPSGETGIEWVTLGGLVATTFILVAAFFQTYLVKAKGWTERDIGNATLDTLLASVIYTLIGCVIMATAATVLYPHTVVNSADAMASQLEGLFGPNAKLVFAIGFGAAAFSSFITNSLIGGVVLNDGLGLGGQLDSQPTKLLAAAILALGMFTSLAIIHQENTAPAVVAVEQANVSTDSDKPVSAPAPSKLKVNAIAIGQATTLLAVPLGVVVTLVVLFDRRANQKHPLPLAAKGFVIVGVVLLLGVAFSTFTKLLPAMGELLGSG